MSSTTYNSAKDLALPALPPVEIEPPVLYNELLDIHNAIANISNQGGTTVLQYRVIVTVAADLAGTLRSDVEYFLDGIVDMGTTSIEVPVAGLTIAGYSFDISGLVSSENNYTMFTSPVGGSGNLLGSDYAVAVSGTNSKVYELVADLGSEACEWQRVNYISCTSLGSLSGYRQGLETGTGRFGGTPSLELIGTWTGGFRITTSIVRSIDNAMADALFKAGLGFTMASRFLSDINVDLGTLAPLLDFAPANFTGSSLLQLSGCIVSRNGVVNADDATITPNIAASDLESSWSNNQGIANTFEGGTLETTAEVGTTITTTGVFVALAGTFTPVDLQHFDEPANGQLRHLGESPREFSLYADLALAGSANKEVEIRVRKYDASLAATTTLFSQVRVTNNFAGSRDQAFFNFFPDITLDTNDYVFLEVANNTDTSNVTAVTGYLYKVAAR